MEPYLGEIRMFSGDYAPDGWALCDGRILDTGEYSALYSLLGTIYGGNGINTFALPDLRGRLCVGQGRGINLTARSIGEKGGTEEAVITAGQVAAHKHNLQAAADDAALDMPNGALWAKGSNAYSAAGANAVMGAALISPSGSDNQPHNNMMPYAVTNYIIAIEGEYPQRP